MKKASYHYNISLSLSLYLSIYLKEEEEEEEEKEEEVGMMSDTNSFTAHDDEFMVDLRDQDHPDKTTTTTPRCLHMQTDGSVKSQQSSNAAFSYHSSCPHLDYSFDGAMELSSPDDDDHHHHHSNHDTALLTNNNNAGSGSGPQFAPMSATTTDAHPLPHPEPPLFEEAEDCLAQSLLMFLYTDLRLLSATGRINTKFDVLSIDSDFAMKTTAAEMAQLPGATNPYNMGISPAQIMAVLIVELRREVTNQKERARKKKGLDTTTNTTTKGQPQPQPESSNTTNNTNNNNNNNNKESKEAANAADDSDDESDDEGLLLSTIVNKNWRKMFEGGMHANLRAYNEMIGQDLKTNLPELRVTSPGILPRRFLENIQNFRNRTRAERRPTRSKNFSFRRKTSSGSDYSNKGGGGNGSITTLNKPMESLCEHSNDDNESSSIGSAILTERQEPLGSLNESHEQENNEDSNTTNNNVRDEQQQQQQSEEEDRKPAAKQDQNGTTSEGDQNKSSFVEQETTSTPRISNEEEHLYVSPIPPKKESILGSFRRKRNLSDGSAAAAVIAAAGEPPSPGIWNRLTRASMDQPPRLEQIPPVPLIDHHADVTAEFPNLTPTEPGTVAAAAAAVAGVEPSPGLWSRIRYSMDHRPMYNTEHIRRQQSLDSAENSDWAADDTEGEDEAKGGGSVAASSPNKFWPAMNRRFSSPANLDSPDRVFGNAATTTITTTTPGIRTPGRVFANPITAFRNNTPGIRTPGKMSLYIDQVRERHALAAMNLNPWEDAATFHELEDVGNVFFNLLAQPGSPSSVARGGRVLSENELLDLIQDRIQSRDTGQLDFLTDFFKDASASQVMMKSQARIMWLNDWFPIKDCIYAIAVDKGKKRVLVVFRGAITKADWNHGFDAAFKRTPNPIQEDYPNKLDYIRVHRGFYRYLFRQRKDTNTSKYDEIANKVHEYGMQQIGDDYNLVVNGFSLGAALSTLFGFYASTDPRFTKNGPIKIFTFGCPYVAGNSFAEAFCQQEDTRKVQLARFYNRRDFVTHLPFNVRPTKVSVRN